MNLIMSQTQQGASEQGKKGNCHKCGKPGHWANKCPENANSSRKNHTNGGNRNRGERAHKKKSWCSTQPAAGTAMSKKVKDKPFNWCEKCKRWTTTHTTATHTGGNKNKINISSAATVPTANLSTIAPDPSVWILDFDTSPTTTTISLLRAFVVQLRLAFLATSLLYSTRLSLFSSPPSSFASFLHFLLSSPSISPRPSHGPLYLTGLSTLFVKSTLIIRRSYSPLSFGSPSSRSRSGNLDANSRSRLVLLGSNVVVLQSCFDLT